jgi:16S rRNA (uracil1498-N3)-methyltransferase
MRLSRIHVDAEIALHSTIILPPDRGHYVKNVLRLKNSQQIVLFNGLDDNDYTAEIQIQGKQVSAKALTSLAKQHDSPANIALMQAIGKPEHTDFVIQKGTELGVNRFVLFNSSRTQSPLKGNRLQKKLAHWEGIAISASEQCNRNRIPQIEFANDIEQIMQNRICNRILLDFNGVPFTQLKTRLNPASSFEILTGCEGGFTEAEIERVKQAGYLACTAGPRTLRMETAAISITSLVQHHFGDMN